MALTQDFELLVRAALLHQVQLPSLENYVAELISEKTRLSLIKIKSVVDNVLVVPPVDTSDKTILLVLSSKWTWHKGLHNTAKSYMSTLASKRSLLDIVLQEKAIILFIHRLLEQSL